MRRKSHRTSGGLNSCFCRSRSKRTQPNTSRFHRAAS